MQTTTDLASAVQTFFSWGVLLALAAAVIWYLRRLERAAHRTPVADRRFDPALVWILLVPIVHLYWSFRTAKGISADVAWARHAAGLPSRPTGRGVGAAAAWALLLSAGALLLSIAASALASLAVRQQLAGDLMSDQSPAVFFQTLASLFGVGVLVLWIAVAACFVAFVHQVETATADLPETTEDGESTEAG